MRDVYVRPPQESQLVTNQFMKLLKPLYGMTDTGDYWNNYFLASTQRTQYGTDHGGYESFLRVIRVRLSGLVGSHVDDTLTAGGEESNDYPVGRSTGSNTVQDSMKK